MIKGIITLIGGVVGLLSVLANIYLATSPKRVKEKRDEEVQQGRQDLVNGNADAVQLRLDKLLREDNNSNARSKSS